MNQTSEDSRLSLATEADSSQLPATANGDCNPALSVLFHLIPRPNASSLVCLHEAKKNAQGKERGDDNDHIPMSKTLARLKYA